MKTAPLAMLKFFALLFILPGLAGLIASAMISAHYLDTLPRWPVVEENRVFPRTIHGIVVYQTVEEDRKLRLMECSSVGVFVIGLGLGLVYLKQWGGAQAGASEEDSELARRAS
jgi:hypothetical protein